jgi:hypothetical protein
VRRKGCGLKKVGEKFYEKTSQKNKKQQNSLGHFQEFFTYCACLFAGASCWYNCWKTDNKRARRALFNGDRTRSDRFRKVTQNSKIVGRLIFLSSKMVGRIPGKIDGKKNKRDIPAIIFG